MFKICIYCVVSLSIAIAPVYANGVNSLANAIELAIANDPWLNQNQSLQDAQLNQSIAANTLPDPRISFGLMNLPVDSWQLDQEAMTQITIGVSQMFARGNTLSLEQQKLIEQASQQPLLRQNRKAYVKRLITRIWLEGYRANKTISLINRDKVLFDQLLEISQSSYGTTQGNTRQQDIISAQLELIKLEDRLLIEQQKLEQVFSQLSPWLLNSDIQQLSSDNHVLHVNYGNALPRLVLRYGDKIKNKALNNRALYENLQFHPLMHVETYKQAAARQDVSIMNEKYKPQWGVSASYGIRNDDQLGDSRADFFSIGVSVDMPIFTENKQDKLVQAAISRAEAVETDRVLLLRKLTSNVQTAMTQLHRLKERYSLYEKQIMQKTIEQAESALTAYTNDNGDFTDVIRARIAKLDTDIARLDISVKALQVTADLNYYFTKYEPVDTKQLAVGG